jgi:hypothetical protein
MTDTSNLLTALSGFFFGNDKNDPRVNPQLRQRIALAMMARGTKYPKTFGEGLSAIGEAIGDRGMQRMLEQSDLAQQDAASRLKPPADAAAPTPYAPPSDDLANAPAVQAIEAATSQPQVIPPPAPPPAPPQAPGRGFTPVPMQPGAGEVIDPGEYNAIDAADPRNRYKPAPAYLAPDLNSLIKDPERRGFLGQLAGKEAQSPNEISPTGAAGPFQFTRGTGAQYGVPGNARLDPKASILAADRLTDDNVATLTAKLGRDPTPGEMALAHQQGAGTAGNMLTGAGNASASNLAVNNVPPGMGPGAAAQKIMGYYGMPGAGVTTPGPRDAVAAALAAQQQPQPPQRPTVADYGQPLALAATPQAAPPVPSGIRAAPQPQVAQAQPQAGPQQPDFGYVMPPVDKVVPPKATDIGKIEAWAIDQKQKNQNNPYAQQDMDRIIAVEAAKRAQQDKVLNEQFIAEQTLAREKEMKRQGQIETKAKRTSEGEGVQRDADIAKRFGGPVPYQQFVADTSKSYDATQQLANSLPNYQQAKQALAQSYTGKGADLKLDANKMLRAIGVPGDYTPAVATEMLQSRMKAIAGGLIKSTVGSQNISDADREFVEKAYSGTISMEPESLRKLLGIAEDTSIRSINRHNDRLNSVANDPEKDAAIRNQYSVPMQYGDSAVNYLKAHPETADLFDKKFGKGHAKAVLMGARYGQ